MLKKFFTYPVFLVIVLSIIILILYGALLRHHYSEGQRFHSLQKIAVFFATIPANVKKMVELKTFNINKIQSLQKHLNKKRFQQFIPNKRNAFLVLPRYDISLGRSLVDVIDLNNFEVIHTYKHDIAKMNEQVQNIDEHKRINIDHTPIRFQYRHH